MTDHADIAELDDAAWRLRTAWRIAVDKASTLTREFQDLERQFASGKYGPEWTFSRWLTVKCGMSLRTTYRIIQQLHRVASEDQREQTRQALEQERRTRAQERSTRAQLKADQRATKIAWAEWLLEEKQRITATQIAWDEWRTEEKQRIGGEKEAERQAKAEERKKEVRRERNRRHRRLKKEESVRQIKEMNGETLFIAENEKAVPNLAQLESFIAELFGRLVTLLSQLPDAERSTWKRTILREVLNVSHSVEAAE